MTILYEDDALLVVVKPAGVPTQTKKLGQQDMESMIKNYRVSKKEDAYVGVVHRLDQPVEGLMVFAKTKQAAAELSKQVAEKSADKCYYAMVEKRGVETYPGIQTEDGLVLENYLLKDGKTNTSAIVEKGTKDAKLARLHYRVLQENEVLAIVDIGLETGRHHQIRVQFSGAGLPLVGDRKYNRDGVARQNVALCSYKIGFVHPKTKEKMEFIIDNPFSL